MAAVASVCTCAICGDTVENVAAYMSGGGVTLCGSCAHEAPASAIEAAARQTPPEPTRVQPSAATRAMLAALGDRFSMSLPMHAGVIAAAADRAIDAARSARLDLLWVAAVDISRAMEAMTAALGEASPIDTAIASLDQAYVESIDSVRRKLEATAERAAVKELTTQELVISYAVHRSECKSPDTCSKSVALTAEMKRRNLRIQ